MGYEPIGRIRPIAPSPSLLTSARPLPAVNWSTGISWATGCQRAYSWPQCPEFVLPDDPRFSREEIIGEWPPPGTYKEMPDERDIVHTVPFTIYTPYICDGMGPTDVPESEQLVQDGTEVHTAAQIAEALWMGTGLPTDDLEIPTLRRSAVDVSGADPYDLDDGVAALLVHYEQCTGGSGGAVIHMPSALIPGALGGGSGGARVCWPEGTLYRGPCSSVISPGPGYPQGFSPDGPNGHGPLIDPGPPEQYAGNEADTSWIYITGPVEYAVGEITLFPDVARERTIFRQNFYGLFAERPAIVRFDPCCVFAVEVVNPAPLLEVS